MLTRLQKTFRLNKKTESEDENGELWRNALRREKQRRETQRWNAMCRCAAVLRTARRDAQPSRAAPTATAGRAARARPCGRSAHGAALGGALSEGGARQAASLETSARPPSVARRSTWRGSPAGRGSGRRGAVLSRRVGPRPGQSRAAPR